MEAAASALKVADGPIGDDPLLRGYADVREVARFDHAWMVREERNLPILVAPPNTHPPGSLAVTRRAKLTQERLPLATPP